MTKTANDTCSDFSPRPSTTVINLLVPMTDRGNSGVYALRVAQMFRLWSTLRLRTKFSHVLCARDTVRFQQEDLFANPPNPL